MARSVLFERFLHFVRGRGLLVRGDRVLAAVSGGPDSLAMLDCLCRARRTLGIRVFAAHLNHMLRGDEADADERFVRALCRRLRVPLAVKRRDVAAFAKRKHIGTEAAARLARYEFFASSAKRFGCGKVATAHTLSDNAETILQRLIEGAGPAGLRGIPVSRALDAKSRATLIRPLLFAARSDVEAYLASRKLTARTDRTNLEPVYTRNRIRLEVLPRILALNPSAEETISRAGDHVAALMEVLEDEIAKSLEAAVIRRTPGAVTLDRRRLAALPSFLAGEVAKRSILKAGVDGRELSASNVDSVVRTARGARAYASAALPGGAHAATTHENLTITVPKADRSGIATRRKAVRTTKTYERRMTTESVVLRVPGKARLSGGGTVSARLVKNIDLRKFVMSKSRFEEVMDADCVEGSLVVRFARPGDRFHPLGASGGKKLSDFFIDAKVARGERARIPVVADERGLIWVAGYRISDRVKAGPGTKCFLRLMITGASGD